MGAARRDPRAAALGPAAGVRIRTLHRPGPRELLGLAELIDRTARHDGHRPIGDHALIELKQGPRVFPHAAFAATAAEQLVGYAHLSRRETRHGWRLEAFVAPSWRGRGIGTALVGAVLDHVAAHGGGRLHAWAYLPGPAHERIAARFGMRVVRRLLRMSRPLPAPSVAVPPGYRIRAFRPSDAPAWLELHNRAFADHPDAGGWRPEDLAWHLEEPWFEPEGFLLAERADGLAGYCWMKLEDRLGWVYFLGVAPEDRGTGLAPALCAAGLAWAHERGAGRGVLYVDEGNAPALRLYRKLGFEVEHVDLCYEAEVPPRAAVDAARPAGRPG
ncbi:MAG TPA: mycothiol synthase [Actinomycetota bacterium]|nr:mycothiol synthase [Actinomycetota bacterium]